MEPEQIHHKLEGPDVEGILDRLHAPENEERLQRLDSWANEKFARFPKVSSISINVGAMFVVDFTITLTWNK